MLPTPNSVFQESKCLASCVGCTDLYKYSECVREKEGYCSDLCTRLVSLCSRAPGCLVAKLLLLFPPSHIFLYIWRLVLQKSLSNRCPRTSRRHFSRGYWRCSRRSISYDRFGIPGANCWVIPNITFCVAKSLRMTTARLRLTALSFNRG